MAVNGSLIVDDIALVLREHFKAWASLSLDKQGVTEDLAKGRLVRVLQVLLRIMAAMEKST